jgi:hypothetical protein
MSVLQREHWSGQPSHLGEAWRLRKGGRGPGEEAVCTVWSHEFGWELRLEARGELIGSHACRNNEQVLATQEQWKKAMEKGWR